MNNYQELFQKINIGGVELENRIIHGPATTNFGGENGEVVPQILEYYRARARGGPGLVITEACYVTQNSKAWPRQIGVDKDEFISGLKLLADAIHDAGPKVFLQLCHAGRKASSAISGEVPVCSSAVPLPGCETPKELSEQEILDIIDQFGDAALRAKKAGFDGVDIHSGHGNLPISFYSPLINKRTDQWNGSLENRARFLIEIVKKIKSSAGEDFPVSVKISAEEFVDNGFHLDEAKEMCKMLVDAGADAICAYAGPGGDVGHRNIDKAHEFAGSLPLGVKDAPLTYIAEEIKKVVDIPIMTVGRLSNPEVAASIIRDGKADLVQVSRGFIAEPEWANKVKNGETNLIRPCVACGNGCFSSIKLNVGITCAVNPSVGKEYLGVNLPSDKMKILVVGGGPSGLEAGISAAQRGHEVTLLEETDKVGGQLRLAANAPGRERIGLLSTYLENMALLSGVKIVTGTKCDMETIDSFEADEVIVASGAEPVTTIPFEVNDGVKLYNSWNVLDGELPSERTLAVIGGGIVGCEVADYLAENGCSVKIIEMIEDIMVDEFYDLMPDERTVMRAKLDHFGVEIFTLSKVQRVTPEGVQIDREGEIMVIPADGIVMAIGSRSKLPEGFVASDNIHLVGDCVKARRIRDAIAEGYKIGMNV